MAAGALAIRHWLVCISGFTQTVDSPTGLHTAWLRLGRFYRGPETCVELRPWKADFRELAESIKLASGDRPPVVVIVGYSWGAGRGFVELAGQLRHRDIPVAAAVLCDPVYYSVFNPLGAILGERIIDVPDTVREVHWLFQRENFPRGHRPVAVDASKTTVYPGVELAGVTHESMDDAWQFQQMVDQVIGDVLKREAVR